MRTFVITLSCCALILVSAPSGAPMALAESPKTPATARTTTRLPKALRPLARLWSAASSAGHRLARSMVVAPTRRLSQRLQDAAAKRLPVHLWALPRRRAARAELAGHARELGLSPPGGPGGWCRAGARIVEAEIGRSRAAEPRISAATVKKIMRRFARAQAQRPDDLRVLFGFSHMLDTKALLVPGKGGGDWISRLAEGHDKKALADLVARGPADERWSDDPARPGVITQPLTLAAAIIHHQLVGEGRSLQLQIDGEAQRWIESLVGREGVTTRRAVGGAAAFGANLAAALGRVRPSFHSQGRLSEAQATAFERAVRVITPESGPRGVSAPRAFVSGAPTKINYIVEVPADLRFSVNGENRMQAGGEQRSCRTPHVPGRIILSTKASYEPTFDESLGKEGLSSLARANDLFVMVGLHYLTGYDGARLARVGARLASQLDTMREANPDLVVHYQYVRAKDPANEWRAFAAVHGRVDSLSLNSTELGELARNLDGRVLDRRTKAAVRMPQLAAASDRATQEDPRRMYRLARAVMKATGVERLHVHGFDVDLILVQGGDAERMYREGSAAMKGRQLGVNKVGGTSGEVRRRRDIWRVLPTVSAVGLAAIYRFADGLASDGLIPAAAKRTLVERGVFIHPADGIGVSITPTRQFHHRAGGLVSLGDTLDITTLLHALPRSPSRSHRRSHP